MMAVNARTWMRFPVADRDQAFNADHAIKRIQQASAGSVETFNMAFLWRGENLPPNNKNSYRLPIADIINGRFTLIPHAVFTAAAILQGAHGGLEGVVGEDEKKQLRDVVTRIYDKLRQLFSDERLIPPWMREDVPPADRPNRQISTTAAGSINTTLLDLPVSQDDQWNHMEAGKQLWRWAEGDYRRYRRGFVWWDGRGNTQRMDAYALPVTLLADGQLHLSKPGVAALARELERAPQRLNVPDSALPELKQLVAALLARTEGEGEQVTENSGPLRPPAHWFDDPMLQGPTPLTVTADGQVTGHLALWNVCHFGIADTCRMAPRSASGYKYFMTGEVVTADGSTRRVGRITVGTGHANLRLGYIPAADHYDNTGTAVAIVAAGEDQYGPWVNGARIPGVSEEKIAELRRSPLSGDWRPTSHGLELVAALAVNTPGFPVVGYTASGEVQSLVAAGMVLSAEEIEALGVRAAEAPAAGDPELAQRLERFQARADRLSRQARSNRLDSILKRLGG